MNIAALNGKLQSSSHETGSLYQLVLDKQPEIELTKIEIDLIVIKLLVTKKISLKKSSFVFLVKFLLNYLLLFHYYSYLILKKQQIEKNTLTC